MAMAKTEIDLSIIIASFNTQDLTSQAISSVVKETKNINYEIIVIDNDSHDGSIEVLEDLASKYKNIKLILNKENVGFGGANNQGMKEARGRYVLLLNSDTLISDNVLEKMVVWMDENQKAGIATCSLLFKEGNLQGTGGYFPTLPRVFMWMTFLDDIPGISNLIKPFHPMHGLSPLDKNEDFFTKKHQMDWITGAFFIIRKEVVEQMKGFDKDYFMYVEEVDYCYRAKKNGWEIWYLPEYSIIHYGGASSTAETPILGEIKGLKIFYKKHMPKWQLPILSMILKFGAILRILIFGLSKGFGVAKIYAKAFMVA